MPKDIDELQVLNRNNTMKSVRIALMLRKGLVIKLKRVPKSAKQVELQSRIYNFILYKLNVL